MAVVELKKGLSDAKAGKPIHFAFIKGSGANKLLMSKAVLTSSTKEVSEAKKECNGTKVFVGKCGGLDEKGKVFFYIDALGEDEENKSLNALIEKEAAAAKVSLKVHTAAPPPEPTPSTSTTPESTPTTPTPDTDQRYYEAKFPQVEGDYRKALATPNEALRKQMETLYEKAKQHAEAREFRKANEAMGVLSLAIVKALPTLPGATPITSDEEEPKTTTTTGPTTPVGEFDAKLKEVQALLAEALKTPGFDPAELKSLQKMLKQALMHKGQKDYEAGTDLLGQMLVAARSGISTAASKPKEEAPTDESVEAKVERVLKERAAKREHDKIAERIAVDSIIAAMPPEMDLLAVRAIMTEHAKKVPLEDKAFAGMRFFDDVMLIKEPAKRVEKLRAIHKAMADARDRRVRMAIELTKLPKPTTDEQKAAMLKAESLRGNMMNHVPEWWQTNWSDDFEERIRVMALDPEARRKELATAKAGFSEEDKRRQKETFAKSIDPRSLKGIEAHDSYFDQLTSAPTTEELQEMALVTKDLLKKARQIRDAGGTFADVKEALAHVPETWWPAELLDYMQAWRKVERELLEERVRDRFAEAEDTTLDTVEGAIGFVASALELYSGTEWMKAPEVASTISTFVGAVSTGFGLGKGWGETVTKEGFGKWNREKLEAFGDQAAESISSFCSTLAGLKDGLKGKLAIPEKSVLAAKVLPGLAIAAAGIDLMLALKKLGEHSYTTHQTRRMVSDAERDWASGQDEDGGAFVRALVNERTGRKLQLSKDSVEVTTTSLELAGAIGEASGMGSAAGLGIKITGKVIEYGGKIVFSGIEWGMANTAKTLIREAQAGNPVARIQIMEDCNLYAKMYIAVLVRDGHPMGKKFIEQRGIEEGDLSDSMALKILREAMLASVDQRAETEVSDNLAAALIEGVGAGGVLSVGEKIGELATAIKNKWKDRKAGEYDAAWKYNPGKVTLVRDSWDTTKSEAFTKGLHDDPTGIGAALDAVQVALRKVDIKNKDKNTKENVVAAVDALKDVMTRLNNYVPMTVPHGEKKEIVPHKGMTLYVVAMKKHVAENLSLLDKLLVDRGDRNPGWTTDKKTVNAVEWKAAWDDAVAKAMIVDNDQGVEEAMKAALTAMEDRAIGGKDKALEREAQLTARDRLVDLIKALDACWAAVGDCQGMRDYCEALKGAAAQYARTLQKQMFDVAWSNPIAGMADEVKFSSAGWNTVWTAAGNEGVVQKSKGEAGVGAALREYEAKKTALDKVLGGDPKKVLAARQEMVTAFTGVFAAATSFIGVQKEAVKDVVGYANFIVKTAQQGSQAMSGMMASVDFTPSPGFDPVNWKKTYNAAIAAGALSPAGSQFSALETALKEHLAAQINFTKEKRPKEKRALAHAVKAKLGAVQVAVSKMAAADGYADHAVMGKYLTGLEAEVGKKLQAQELTDVIDGALPTPSFGPQTWAWTKSGWLAVKNPAIDAGLFDSGDTGFTGKLETAQKSFTAWQSATRPEDKKNKAATARAGLRAMIDMAQAFAKATKNANLKKFFKDGIEQANARIELMKDD